MKIRSENPQRAEEHQELLEEHREEKESSRLAAH